MKRSICLLIVLACALPVLAGDKYFLQPDGTVIKKSAAPEPAPAVAEETEETQFVAAMSQDVVCDPFTNICRQVPTQAIGVSYLSGTSFATSEVTTYSASTEVSAGFQAAREPRFPFFARRRAARGAPVMFTRPVAFAAPAMVAPAVQLVAAAPVQSAPVAAAVPLGAPEPPRLMLVGRHTVSADKIDQLRAAGWSWREIWNLVQKYGPIVIDIIEEIRKK